jgi:hypothetical protein
MRPCTAASRRIQEQSSQPSREYMLHCKAVGVALIVCSSNTWVDVVVAVGCELADDMITHSAFFKVIVFRCVVGSRAKALLRMHP